MKPRRKVQIKLINQKTLPLGFSNIFSQRVRKTKPEILKCREMKKENVSSQFIKIRERPIHKLKKII